MAFSPISTWACNCIPKTEIDIRDWNDTEYIFKGKLIAHQKMPAFTKLEFELITSIKGDNKEKVTTYIKGHSGLHHVDTFYINQEWIVFGQEEEIRDKKYFRFVYAGDNHCATSRPIKKEDNYLSFMSGIIDRNGKQSFTKDGTIYASGDMKKGIPKGKWTYLGPGSYRWEGKYKKGKRSGKWLLKGMNISNEMITIEKAEYKCGKPESIIYYNFVGVIRREEFFDEDQDITNIYRNGHIAIKIVVDHEADTRTRYYYENGEVVRTEKS